MLFPHPIENDEGTLEPGTHTFQLNRTDAKGHITSKPRKGKLELSGIFMVFHKSWGTDPNKDQIEFKEEEATFEFRAVLDRVEIHCDTPVKFRSNVSS